MESLVWCFSNLNVHVNPLEIAFKCQIRLNKSGVELMSLNF